MAPCDNRRHQPHCIACAADSVTCSSKPYFLHKPSSSSSSSSSCSPPLCPSKVS